MRRFFKQTKKEALRECLRTTDYYVKHASSDMECAAAWLRRAEVVREGRDWREEEEAARAASAPEKKKRKSRGDT